MRVPCYGNIQLMPNHKPRPRLIVLEGIDLSGRTTQVQLLHDWLVALHYPVTTTAWRTSPLISNVLKQASTGSMLQPLTYSMLYCADHLDRTQHVIKPALELGEIVLADRYIYTAFARDEARGMDRAWVRNLYRFSIEPDAVFYLHISPDEAVKRRLHRQQEQQQIRSMKKGKKSSARFIAPATSPLPFSQEALESFRTFERKMYSQYQSMQKEFGFTVIEGSQSIDLVQLLLRSAVAHLLVDG